MDRLDAEAALDLINDYWPNTLERTQIERWATVLIQTGADFDQTCQWIAEQAAANPYPPRLNDICTAVRPRPEPPALEDSGPPVERTRGQAWAAHTSSIGRIAAARREQHDHRNGWQRCPVCTTPGNYQRCGLPSCPICSIH